MTNQNLPSLWRIEQGPPESRNGSCHGPSAAPAGQPFGIRRTILGILSGALLALLADLAVDFPALAAALISS